MDFLQCTSYYNSRMDGWIVCEEFKDILLAAWDEEQEIIREKEQEVLTLSPKKICIRL